MIGAGEGNRTLVLSLEGCCSTIELHPRFGRQTRKRMVHSTGVRNCGLACVVRDPVVGEVGLEPTKAKPADLQSAPFAARDTPPNLASGRIRGSSRVMGSALGGVN